MDYQSKIDLLGVDPANIPVSKQKNVLDLKKSELPDFCFADIFNYLINKPGEYYSTTTTTITSSTTTLLVVLVLSESRLVLLPLLA